MRKQIALLCTLVFSPAEAFPQDYATGNAAYQEGDYATAIIEWRPLAEQGNTESQYALGKMYAMGHGVRQDSGKAVFWLEKAAAKNHVSSQALLARVYIGGGETPRNIEKAAFWFRKAAEQGDALSQFNTGLMFERGEGNLQQSYKTAAEWYLKAAEQGEVRAQSILGSMFHRGEEGVPRNYKQAAKWSLAAARPCCTNRPGDSLRESGMIAEWNEQLGPYEVQDQELAFVQHSTEAARITFDLV